MNADARQERAETVHEAEEAVAAAVKRMDDAVYALHHAAVTTTKVGPEGLTRALIDQNRAVEEVEAAEFAYDDAVCDRDRVSGERT